MPRPVRRVGAAPRAPAARAAARPARCGRAAAVVAEDDLPQLGELLPAVCTPHPHHDARGDRLDQLDDVALKPLVVHVGLDRRARLAVEVQDLLVGGVAPAVLRQRRDLLFDLLLDPDGDPRQGSVVVSLVHEQRLDVLADRDREGRVPLRGLELLVVHAVVAELVPELLRGAAEPDVKEPTTADVGPVPGFQQLLQLVVRDPDREKPE
mmetsp:Transcript_119162/g.337819  ORF Transcript_119162/g.337819 Transcript_119162/m.337819 type:complete len:209 (+) Transcript_119162:496-1122(+)